MMNVNFKAQPKVKNIENIENIAKVTKEEASRYFPSSTLIKFETPTPLELQVRGPELESFLASRKNLPPNTSEALKKAQANAASEAYARAHGIPIE